MVRKILSLVCCIAMCAPVITGVVSKDAQTTNVVAYADNYNMKSSSKAVGLIKECEGFASKAYWDYKQWTIGYGTYVESNTKYPNGISEAEAEQLLYNALVYYEDCVNGFLKRNQITVNQDQFDALVCFTYAIPAWSYKGNEDYSLAQMMINGWENYSEQQIYDIFGLYVKAGSGENKVTLPGLVRRRLMEASLFLYGDTTNTVPKNASSTGTTTTTQTPDVSTSTDVAINTSNTSSDVQYTSYKVFSDNGISLRSDYGLDGDKLIVIPQGAVISTNEVVTADGHQWGKVDYDGITGWCVLDYCDKMENNKVIGDVNGDGKLSVQDASLIKRYVYNAISLTDEQLKMADLNNDGNVTIDDYDKFFDIYLN